MLRGFSDVIAPIVEAVTTSFDDLLIAKDRDTIVEFTRKSASKAGALRHLLDKIGISSSSVMAFGDGLSDASMLKMAGIGIAMYNASDEVKSAADEVTLSSDEDGVGFTLRKYFPVVDSWLSTSA
jgi:hydroxymethylpyrimidine pyrophosphatase-like HAD family hydrolase